MLDNRTPRPNAFYSVLFLLLSLIFAVVGWTRNAVRLICPEGLPPSYNGALPRVMTRCDEAANLRLKYTSCTRYRYCRSKRRLFFLACGQSVPLRSDLTAPAKSQSPHSQIEYYPGSCIRLLLGLLFSLRLLFSSVLRIHSAITGRLSCFSQRLYSSLYSPRPLFFPPLT